MGLEVLEEFWPITPVRISRTINRRSELSDLEIIAKELSNGEEECLTPRSPSRTLMTPLVCPPAPKKPLVARRNLAPPCQGFFYVPHDLASVFVLHSTKPSKKIRPSS